MTYTNICKAAVYTLTCTNVQHLHIDAKPPITHDVESREIHIDIIAITKLRTLSITIARFDHHLYSDCLHGAFHFMRDGPQYHVSSRAGEAGRGASCGFSISLQYDRYGGKQGVGRGGIKGMNEYRVFLVFTPLDWIAIWNE